MAVPRLFAAVTGSASGASQVESGPTVVSAFSIYNPNTGAGYIQFLDSTASPVVGTLVPSWSIALPAASSLTLNMTDGVMFTAGLWIAATTTATGATGVATAMTVDLLVR